MRFAANCPKDFLIFHKFTKSYLTFRAKAVTIITRCFARKGERRVRVITGTARGRTLETLPSGDVRPTADRVKEAIFSIVQFELEGRRVLDLFAGSGQLGIEALSRGAASAVFVDRNRAAAALVERNLRTTRLLERARVVRGDALVFLAAAGERFDLAFLDPPYGMGLLQKGLAALPGRMAPGGTILCEAPADERLPETLPGGPREFFLGKPYRYGRTTVAVYRMRPEEETP
jgi:16S rRNA (guanine(966)-N(2))-methyltransferase RsmD